MENAQQVRPETTASAVSSPRRILIVEDEPNVRLVFRTALESKEYALSTAEDGEEALSSLGKGPLDLVLLDLQMPRMGGMELLERLRATGNNTPVVVITAHDSVPNVVQAMRLGAIDFLSKPLAPEDLRRVVAEVLARHAPQAAVAQPEAPDRKAAQVRESLSKAKQALNHREFNVAETLLRKVTAQDPKLAEAHYLLGILCELRDERHAAYTAYRAALRADPNFEPAKLHLMKYFNDRLM
jgi:DNA-binding response OmpR family regulator